MSSLMLPLSPFIALSTFLIDQHPSLTANPYHTDHTIQYLYSLAIHVFQEQIYENEKPVEDLILVCQKTESTITQAIAILSEVSNITKWSRTRKVLEDGKLIPDIFKQKYQAITNNSNNNVINININTNTIRQKKYCET